MSTQNEVSQSSRQHEIQPYAVPSQEAHTTGELSEDALEQVIGAGPFVLRQPGTTIAPHRVSR